MPDWAREHRRDESERDGDDEMRATRRLHDLGQSIWLDNISRELLQTGTLQPFTINTMPETTLKAFADHGQVGPLLPADGGDCDEVLAQFAAAGVDVDALANEPQRDGAKAFVDPWYELMDVIASKSAVRDRAR
jgi:transaldolase